MLSSSQETTIRHSDFLNQAVEQVTADTTDVGLATFRNFWMGQANTLHDVRI